MYPTQPYPVQNYATAPYMGPPPQTMPPRAPAGSFYPPVQQGYPYPQPSVVYAMPGTGAPQMMYPPTWGSPGPYAAPYPRNNYPPGGSVHYMPVLRQPQLKAPPEATVTPKPVEETAPPALPKPIEVAPVPAATPEDTPEIKALSAKPAPAKTAKPSLSDLAEEELPAIGPKRGAKPSREPQGFAEETGERVGQWITGFLKSNPEWEQRLQKFDLTQQLDAIGQGLENGQMPEALQGVRDQFKKSWLLRNALPWLEKPILVMCPYEYRLILEKGLRWLQGKPTK